MVSAQESETGLHENLRKSRLSRCVKGGLKLVIVAVSGCNQESSLMRFRSILCEHFEDVTLTLLQYMSISVSLVG